MLSGAIVGDLVIFGAGGFAREVHELVEDSIDSGASWTSSAFFLDDDPATHGRVLHRHTVLGDASWLSAHPDTGVVVAVGGTAAKRRIVQALRGAGHTRFPTLIHPRARRGRRVTVGSGVVVCAGVMITTDASIGDHVILNLGCTVGHDVLLGDDVTVAPSVNVSGAVTIEDGCDVGTGSQIIQGVTIGHWTVVGAGSVVVRDLPPNVTAVGVPARVIKERPDAWQAHPERILKGLLGRLLPRAVWNRYLVRSTNRGTDKQAPGRRVHRHLPSEPLGRTSLGLGTWLRRRPDGDSDCSIAQHPPWVPGAVHDRHSLR